MTKLTKGIIDRFEGEIVIIEIDGETKEYERCQLPKEAKQGDVVVMSEKIVIDVAATKERKQRVEKLMNDLWED